MKGWGVTLILIGVLSFVLPRFGMVPIWTALFGAYYSRAAVGFIVLGVVLVVAGFLRERSKAPPPA